MASHQVSVANEEKKLHNDSSCPSVTAVLLRAFSFLHLEYKIENKGRNVTTGGFQLVTHMLLTSNVGQFNLWVG